MTGGRDGLIRIRSLPWTKPLAGSTMMDLERVSGTSAQPCRGRINAGGHSCVPFLQKSSGMRSRSVPVGRMPACTTSRLRGEQCRNDQDRKSVRRGLVSILARTIPQSPLQMPGSTGGNRPGYSRFPAVRGLSRPRGILYRSSPRRSITGLTDLSSSVMKWMPATIMTIRQRRGG